MQTLTQRQKPISCGLYRFTPGTELEYAYHYHEMKIIVEGGGIVSPLFPQLRMVEAARQPELAQAEP